MRGNAVSNEAFLMELRQQLDTFSAYAMCDVEVSDALFSVSRARVVDVVVQVEQTAVKLVTVEGRYRDYYADRLVKQFAELTQAVGLLAKKGNPPPSFQGHYVFPKNVHQLPPPKRLVAYKRALRALNEKLAWLSEQCYAVDEGARAPYVAQLAETEYRKQKCIAAIEALEAEMMRR